MLIDSTLDVIAISLPLRVLWHLGLEETATLGGLPVFGRTVTLT